MYSAYMMRASGKKDAEEYGLLEAATPDSDLVQRGLYYQQLKRFQKFLSIEKMLVLIYEDKFKDPVNFIQGIYGFLEVDRSFIPPSIDVQTKAGVFEREHKLLLSLSRFLLSSKMPIFIRKLYSRIRPPHETSDISEHVRLTFEPLFRTDIARLEELLDRDLSCWRS
jgi:hypothetical protein